MAPSASAQRDVHAAGTGPGQFLSPHGIAVNSRGDIYVGEVSYTAWPHLFPDRPVPRTIRSLQKFDKISTTDSVTVL